MLGDSQAPGLLNLDILCSHVQAAVLWLDHFKHSLMEKSVMSLLNIVITEVILQLFFHGFSLWLYFDTKLQTIKNMLYKQRMINNLCLDAIQFTHMVPNHNNNDLNAIFIAR